MLGRSKTNHNKGKEVNHYEKQQTDKKAHYETRAQEEREKSAKLFEQARELAGHIPMGQPILVGHHSEKRHRRHLGQIDRLYAQAQEADERAKRYDRKAQSVGRGGISSDDPAAIEKLRAELEEIEEAHELGKKANRIARSKKKTEAEKIAEIIALGYNEETAKSLIEPDYMGKVGFPSYVLSGNTAKMRRIKQRIAELEERQGREDVEIERDEYTYREDVRDNRVSFEFDCKPSKEVRDLLKRNGFKWSPSRGAWVRQLNDRGLYAAKQVMRDLDQ